MPKKVPLPTAKIQEAIAAYVRAGGYPHVAAEAAGVPREVFEEWLRKAEGERPRKEYKAFAEALRDAAAQARLAAETRALKDKPMDWLKAGPGKETASEPGWSALAKPRPGAAEEAPLSENPQVQKWVRVVLRALEPFPEARAAVAAALAELREEEARLRTVPRSASPPAAR
jgi:hypothetical protein